MKKTFKSLLTLTAAVLIFSAMCIFASAADNAITDFSVTPAGASDIAQVEWYCRDGVYYIFLPSYADSDDLTVNFSASDDVYCGDTLLKNGITTDIFSGGGNFTLTCGNSSYSVTVMEASSVGSIYITTESGSMSAVHADKEHKEPGEILILDENGEVQYDGALEYIKGRGNSTWTFDKKPYNIKLDKKADLFGMGKSKKWCLLANASDPSVIRNMLAYDLAINLGVDVTSETYQLNLYINGEYAGLYLITEKVEIDDNRIEIYDLEGETEDVNAEDLDSYPLKGAQNSRVWGSIKYADIPNDPEEITGGYLLELEKIYRYVNEPSGFITNIGQAVVVKTPEYASKAQVEYISSYYQEFEDALYSSTGCNSSGKHYSEYIDVDSLARMYVLDEFSANFDGCSSSFYLYKDVDGKLVAGPAWDFDLGLGHVQPNDLINHVANVAEPSLLYIQTCFIGNHNEKKNALLAQAFSHNDFQDKVEEIWNGEFNGYYDTFLSNIETWSNDLIPAVTMNAVRWNTFGTANTNDIANSYNSSVSVIRNYVTARYAFLSEAYSEDTYFVKYDIGDYGNKLVNDTSIYKKGATAVIKAGPTSTDSMQVFEGWSLSPDGSGKLYKEGDAITVTENTKFYAVYDFSSVFDNPIKQFITNMLNFIQKLTDIFSKIFK